MNRFIMCILALGALLGGIDRLLNNRFGLGKRFEEGFQLLGPTALSMAGIICLSPLLADGLRLFVAPLFRLIGLDPALLGGLVAMDMGGYQLAMALCESPVIGAYAGVVVAATLGCTVTFTIPVGMGMTPKGDRPLFARGILIGLCTMPPALVISALMCGLSLGQSLFQSLPVFLFSGVLIFGIVRFPAATLKAFSVFAAIIRALTTLGLTIAAVQYMSGFTILPSILPIEEAMAIVSSVGVVLLGSLPMAELLQRALKKPMAALAQKTGLNQHSLTGLLIGAVSVMPAIALIREMDKRGKIVNAASMVCAASALAGHVGFAFAQAQSYVLPLLVAKLLGGVFGAGAALFLTRRKA